jgi:hypothetical protein
MTFRLMRRIAPINKRQGDRGRSYLRGSIRRGCEREVLDKIADNGMVWQTKKNSGNCSSCIMDVERPLATTGDPPSSKKD